MDPTLSDRYWGETMRSLWANIPRLCDAEILVKWRGEKTTFQVHKLILSLTSDKFREDFHTNSASDPVNRLEIINNPPIVIRFLLEYIYTGQVRQDGIREMNWVELGGVLCTAQEYGIIRMIEAVTSALDKHWPVNEVVLQFKALTELTSAPSEYPRHYYPNLMKCLLSYILRHADAVLKTLAFCDLSIKTMSELIKSVYFYVKKELYIYEAVNRWSTHQCSKQGLNEKDVLHRRQVLLQPGEHKNFFGALRFVRFKALSDDLDKVTKDKEPLIPEGYLEKIKKYKTTNEDPPPFFENNPRVRSNNHHQEFDAHLTALVQKLWTFPTSNGKIRKLEPAAATAIKIENGQSKSEDPPTSLLPMAKGKSTVRKRAPETNLNATPLRRQKYKNIPALETPTNVGTAQALPTAPGAVAESFEGPNLPESASLGITSLNTDSCAHGPLAPISEEFESHHQVTSQVLQGQGIRAFRAQPSDSEDDGTPMSLSDSQSQFVTPVKNKALVMSGAGKTPVKRKDPKNISVEQSNDTHQENISQLYKYKKRNKPAKEMIPTNRNSAPTSSPAELHTESEDDLETGKVSNRDLAYSDFIKLCRKNPEWTKLVLENIRITDFVKINDAQDVCLPRLSEVKLDTAVSQTWKSIDLKNWIFFHTKPDAPRDERLMDLWQSGVFVHVKICGVVVFVTKPEEGTLTVNHAAYDVFFQLEKLNLLSNLKSLNLGNSTLPEQYVIPPEIAEGLVEIRLLSVSNCQSIVSNLKQCKNLQRLTLWCPKRPKVILNTADLPLALTSLSLSECVVRVKADVNVILPNLEEIALMECTWDPEFVGNLTKMFPNLQRIFIYNAVSHCATAEMLTTLLKIESLTEIVLLNFEADTLYRQSQERTKELLKKLNIKIMAFSECHFVLERGDDGKKWRGKNLSSRSFCGSVYEIFEIESFYARDRWQKIIWPAYEK